MPVPEVIVELEQARMRAGLSRAELARRAGVSTNTVAKVLSTGNAHLYTVLALAAVLHLELYASPNLALGRVPHAPQRVLQPCGTPTAARRHAARGEVLDAACRAAQREYDRDRKRAVAGRRAEVAEEVA